MALHHFLFFVGTLSTALQTIYVPNGATLTMDNDPIPSLQTHKYSPICLEGYVSCLVPPCFIHSCPGRPDAFCSNDYCGGCNARYYDSSRLMLTDSQCNEGNSVGTNLIISKGPDVLALPSNSITTITNADRVTDVTSVSESTARPQKPVRDMDLSKLNKQCPKIGESCTSALSAEDRCCGGNRGSTQCLYDDVDVFGHELGTCCVIDRQSGCSKDVDCCDVDGVCRDGQCVSGERKQKTDGTPDRQKTEKSDRLSAVSALSARGLSGNFDAADLNAMGNDGTVSTNTLVIGLCAMVMVLMATVPAMYWCYRKKCVNTSMSISVREVFRGTEVETDSDREFQDSDDTDCDQEDCPIYVD